MIKRFFLVLILVFSGSGVAHADLPIQSWTLGNGARVLFVQSHALPVLDISVEFDAGTRRDPVGKAGVASLTNAMLARGLHAGSAAEPAMSEAEISDAFADTAAEREGNVDNDRGGVALRTLSSEKERTASVALLARLLAQPSFPLDLLARDRARTIAAIREEETQPEAIAEKAFWRLLYGTHPYAQQETVASVEKISREDLVAFHKTHYVANRAVIAMIGDISRSEAEAVAQALTKYLPQGLPLLALPKVDVEAGSEKWIAHPASQAHILTGMPAVARGDPDYFPLLVGNYTLGGGGFVSRLMQEVREKRGLSYSVYSYFNPLAQPGPFETGLQTQRDQVQDALEVTRSTISNFLREGPTQRELQAAKDNLIGGFALRIDNNKKILANIAMIGFYGLPLDYLDTWTSKVGAVTIAEIKDAFNRKLAIGGLSTVVVGPSK